MIINELIEHVNITAIERSDRYGRVITPYETKQSITVVHNDSYFAFKYSKIDNNHEFKYKDFIFNLNFYVENHKDYLELVGFYNDNLIVRVFQSLANEIFNVENEALKRIQAMIENYVFATIATKKYVLDSYVDYLKGKTDKGQHSIISFLLDNGENGGTLYEGVGHKNIILNGQIVERNTSISSYYFKVINNKLYTTMSNMAGLFGVYLVRHKTLKIKQSSKEVLREIFSTKDDFFDADILAETYLSNKEIIFAIDLTNKNTKLDFYLYMDNANSMTELWIFENNKNNHLQRKDANQVIKLDYIKKTKVSDIVIDYSNILMDLFTNKCISMFLNTAYKQELGLSEHEQPNDEQIETIKILMY